MFGRVTAKVSGRVSNWNWTGLGKVDTEERHNYDERGRKYGRKKSEKPDLRLGVQIRGGGIGGERRKIP
jgi:hypothetical protein